MRHPGEQILLRQTVDKAAGGPHGPQGMRRGWANTHFKQIEYGKGLHRVTSFYF